MAKFTENELNLIIDRLIELLCQENRQVNIADYELHKKTYSQKRQIFHALFMTRKPAPLNPEFLRLQNELLTF